MGSWVEAQPSLSHPRPPFGYGWGVGVWVLVDLSGRSGASPLWHLSVGTCARERGCVVRGLFMGVWGVFESSDFSLTYPKGEES